MALSRETVENVAGLARIKLKQDEIEKLSHQLQAIVVFIDTLKQVDIKDIKPTSHILPIDTIVREDIPTGSLPVDKALENAPRRKSTFFGVPKVLD